jgi:hypothetical protein
VIHRKPLTAYVVQRLSWEYGDDFYHRDPDNDAPVQVFLDRARAEAHRRECEWRHVQEANINPFGYIDGGLEDRTSLPPEEFLRRMREAGMRAEGQGDYEARINFWEQYQGLSDEGRRLVWEAVDRIRFFAVLEVTVDLDE